MSRIYDAFRRVPPERHRQEEPPAPPDATERTNLEEYPAEISAVPSRYAEAPASPTYDTDASLDTDVTERAPAAPFVFSATAVQGGSLAALQESLDGKTIIGADTSSVFRDQYLALARAVESARDSHGLKTLMVMSAEAGDGRTLTATNLALTLSESMGRQVLLIDADLRRPGLHDLFGLAASPGLVDVLERSGADVPISEVSPTLSVLTAGGRVPDPTSLLLSSRMRSLVLASRARFGTVLLDTPPVGAIPDAHFLSWLADGVLLVVAADRTPRGTVEAVVREVGSERFIGAVFNAAAPRVVRSLR
jgi:capsular exopolysaccharide synthesis family protein